MSNNGAKGYPTAEEVQALQEALFLRFGQGHGWHEDAIAELWRLVASARAAEARERYAPLMQAVEQVLNDGHMNTEHLARLRAAWEAA